MPFPPESVFTNVIAAWRAADLSGADMVDLSGNGRTAVNSGGAAFGSTNVLDGWGVGGVPIALGNGFSAYFTAPAAPPFQPLSDGTGALVWAVFRPIFTGTVGVLLDTGAFLPPDSGIYVWYDTVLERIGVELTNYAGPGGPGRIIEWFQGNRFSWKNSCLVDLPHVMAISISSLVNPNIDMWIDGHMLDKLNVDDRQRGPSALGTPTPDPEPRTFSPSAPVLPLRLMCQANNVLQLFQGELAEVGVAASTVTPTTLANLWGWAAATYGITIDTSLPALVLWDGDSLTDNVWRANQFPELVTPLLSKPTANLMRAIAGMELNQQVARVAKQVTPFRDPLRPSNVYVSWGDFINQIADGGTKEDCYAMYVANCQARRAEGWKVVAAPMLASVDVGQVVSDYITAQIVANWPSFADGIARLDTDPHIGTYADFETDWDGGAGPKLYWADGTHFTALGNQIIAPYFAAAIEPLLVPAPPTPGRKKHCYPRGACPRRYAKPWTYPQR